MLASGAATLMGIMIAVGKEKPIDEMSIDELMKQDDKFFPKKMPLIFWIGLIGLLGGLALTVIQTLIMY